MATARWWKEDGSGIPKWLFRPYGPGGQLALAMADPCCCYVPPIDCSLDDTGTSELCIAGHDPDTFAEAKAWTEMWEIEYELRDLIVGGGDDDVWCTVGGDQFCADLDDQTVTMTAHASIPYRWTFRGALYGVGPTCLAHHDFFCSYSISCGGTSACMFGETGFSAVCRERLTIGWQYPIAISNQITLYSDYEGGQYVPGCDDRVQSDYRFITPIVPLDGLQRSLIYIDSDDSGFSTCAWTPGQVEKNQTVTWRLLP